MTDSQKKKCNWCGTTESERWTKGFELRRHLNYCSNDCRFADDVPCYGLFVIILVSIITAFFIPELAIFLGGIESFATIQVTLSILTVVFAILLIKGLNVRKNLPRNSRVSN